MVPAIELGNGPRVRDIGYLRVKRDSRLAPTTCDCH